MIPAPAATLMLVRDVATVDGERPELEVLLLHRNPALEFAGGAHVFPGGRVDGADHGDAEVEPALPALPDDARASTQLGLASGGRAYWVAAVRECFEETGILLADGPGLAPFLADRVRVEAARADLEAGRLSLGELCGREDLVPAGEALRYFGRWVTPEGQPRRYDTRFFLAPAPAGQEPVPDANEALECEWLRPSTALRRCAEGAIELILPTRRCLELLDGFARRADLLTELDAPTGVVPDRGGWRRPLRDDRAEEVSA